MDHPDLVAWHEHKTVCRACTRRLGGGNRIEEIPCPCGWQLYSAAIMAARKPLTEANDPETRRLPCCGAKVGWCVCGV